MPNTYEFIASQTAGPSGLSTIDFQSIPNTYTDLMMMFSLKSNRDSNLDGINFRFNNSSSGYNTKQLIGFGSNPMSDAYSETDPNGVGIASYLCTGTNTATTNAFSNGSFHVINYTSSYNKLANVEGSNGVNAAGGWLQHTGGVWADSAVVNRITIVPRFGTLFTEHSSAYLYGIKKS